MLHRLSTKMQCLGKESKEAETQSRRLPMQLGDHVVSV